MRVCNDQNQFELSALSGFTLFHRFQDSRFMFLFALDVMLIPTPLTSVIVFCSKFDVNGKSENWALFEMIFFFTKSMFSDLFLHSERERDDKEVAFSLLSFYRHQTRMEE